MLYNDLNHDGIRETNEPGISVWQIYIDQNPHDPHAPLAGTIFVVNADAKLLRVFEAVQGRLDVLGPAAQIGQRRFQNLAARQLVEQQTVE